MLENELRVDESAFRFFDSCFFLRCLPDWLCKSDFFGSPGTYDLLAAKCLSSGKRGNSEAKHKDQNSVHVTARLMLHRVENE